MVGAGMEVKMAPHKAKKLMAAAKKQKGARFSMTKEECDMTGGKLTWKGVKSGLKKFAKGYKKYARPIIRPLVRAGIKVAEKAAPAIASSLGVPEAAPFAPIAAEALREIGTETGAYGVKKPRRKMVKKVKKVKKGGSVKTTGGAILRKTCSKELPASSPLIDVGNLQMGSDFIKGTGITKRVARFNSTMTDPALPASNPLVDIGNLQYGQDFIKGGLLYASPKKGGLMRSP